MGWWESTPPGGESMGEISITVAVFQDYSKHRDERGEDDQTEHGDHLRSQAEENPVRS